MGLFKIDYSKPGPGVRPNEPRKKGISRILELLGRDVLSYWKAGTLLLLSMTPLALGLPLALGSHSLGLMALVGIIGGMLVGPQICGLSDTILRSLRDEAGYWWYTYRKSWKQNVQNSLIPGAITGLLCSSILFLLYHGINTTHTFLLGAFVVGTFLSIAVLILVWMQIPVMKLSFLIMVRNALFLIGSAPTRMLTAVAIQILYWGGIWIFAPISFPIIILTGMWMPFFLGEFAFYHYFEKCFQLESEIRKVRNNKIGIDET